MASAIFCIFLGVFYTFFCGRLFLFQFFFWSTWEVVWLLVCFCLLFNFFLFVGVLSGAIFVVPYVYGLNGGYRVMFRIFHEGEWI